MEFLPIRLGLFSVVVCSLAIAATAPVASGNARPIVIGNPAGVAEARRLEAIHLLRAREADPIGMFAHEDASVREEAVDAYGGVEDAPAVKVHALIPLLRDPARGVRAAAIRQLATLPV